MTLCLGRWRSHRSVMGSALLLSILSVAGVGASPASATPMPMDETGDVHQLEAEVEVEGSQSVVTPESRSARDLLRTSQVLQAQVSEPGEDPQLDNPSPDPSGPETGLPERELTEFGDRGQNRWYVQAGAATTLDDDEARRLGLVGAGLSHFFVNGHSINPELNGLAFDQTGDDAVGLNLNALLRWHFHRAENWSLYVDGGAGLLGTTNDVPSAGSQLNFTPQVGGGATIRINDDQRLMVGLRWHHISNADLYPPNPGRDSLFGYVGWNLPR